MCHYFLTLTIYKPDQDIKQYRKLRIWKTVPDQISLKISQWCVIKFSIFTFTQQVPVNRFNSNQPEKENELSFTSKICVKVELNTKPSVTEMLTAAPKKSNKRRRIITRSIEMSVNKNVGPCGLMWRSTVCIMADIHSNLEINVLLSVL